MAETKIKAAQFHGVVGHGTDGYFLMTNADGSMSWSQASTGPSVTSVAYPGDDLAADPAGAQTVVLIGTNFGSSMSVSIGGTAAPAVAHGSSTQLTITTPAKAAGDYDIVVTNTVTGASGTFVNGMSYNGVPTWTTATGSLGTFDSETTISTITLAATEPDGGTITFNITNGALPSGLSLTGANIDGTTTAESSTTLYSFTIEAIDDENQATPRNFSITVNSAEIVPSQNFTINTYTGNGSTQSVEGKIGTAASFNGSSSYIDTSLILNPNAGSVSLWVKTTDTVGCFFGANSNSDTNRFYLGVRDSKFWIGAGNLQVYTVSAADLIDGDWHHVALTLDGTTAKYYLDGNSTPVASINYNSIGLQNTNPIIGGIRTNAGIASGYYFNGSMDQVRVFGKALSSSEVTTLYNEPSNLSTASTTDIFDDGSGVALYEFEEGANDTGNTGTAIDAGQSASFIGINQNYIQLPSGIDTILNTKNFGLSFWVKAPNAATDAVFSTETTNSTFQVHANWGFAGAYALINGGGSDINLGAVDSNWHHIVVTSDGSSSYKGYFDKSYKGASAYRQTSNVGTFLGAHPSGGFNINGQIDQVRIFNRQLSQSDINSLYSETSPSTVDYFSDGNGKALYRLDGNTNDTSGSYNATWNGTAAYSDPAYTGKTLYNGTPTNVGFVGTSFQPDLVWTKGRTVAYDHGLVDSVRGTTSLLYPDLTEAASTTSTAIQSFDSNGFTWGSNNKGNASNSTYVAWCFKGGGNSNTYNVDDTGYSTASDAGLSSANGTTLNGASVNTKAGFSIINYETNINGDNRPAHGLTQEPELVIFKPYDTSALGWYVMTKKIDGSVDFLFLNTSDAKSNAGNNEFIDSTHFRTSFGTSWGSVMAYCFHSVDGYQKVGTYSGDGTSNASNIQNIGFRPRFLLIKASNIANNWEIFDSARDSLNPNNKILLSNLGNAETTYTYGINFLDNGFVPENAWFNGASENFIYLAIA